MSRSVKLDGKKIAQLRSGKGMSQNDLATLSGLSQRTIASTEAGKGVLPGTLTRIASVLGVAPEALSVQELSPSPHIKPESDAVKETSLGKRLRWFDFGERASAVHVMLRWQQHMKLKRARVVAFTAHTIEDLPGRLLANGIQHIDIFIGTKAMARHLKSSRQLGLLDDVWKTEMADLRRYFRKEQIRIRFYDCPPSFTGVALENEVYLINDYLWLPTVNWLASRTPQEYDEHQARMHPLRALEGDDHYTINGADCPSTLVVKASTNRPSKSFCSQSGRFEKAWLAYEKDWERLALPTGYGTCGGIAEMTKDLERLLAGVDDPIPPP